MLMNVQPILSIKNNIFFKYTSILRVKNISMSFNIFMKYKYHNRTTKGNIYIFVLQFDMLVLVIRLEHYNESLYNFLILI